MTTKTHNPADTVEQWPIGKLVPYARNSRTHSSEQVGQIAASIKEWGFTTAVLVDEAGSVIAGHGRLLAAQRLQMAEVPVMVAKGWSDAKKRAYVIADNKLALNAGWDNELLALELGEIGDLGFDLDLTGFSFDEIKGLGLEGGEGDEGGSGEGPEDSKGNLASRFLVPPFSVINAREGWWQERKRAWLALGIKSEEGRPSELLGKESKNSAYGKTSAGVDASGKLIYNESVGTTSVFDPVLCELAYTWFSAAGGVVLDPFAGGSVRGIVASKLGRQYIGHELRQEQVNANREQGSELCGDDPAPPAWICGDSRGIDTTCADVQADMIFSCPPYADLEVYSSDPKDLSTLGYEEFRTAYFEIIKKSCALLKQDRFACFVVGEVRDKKGNYYNFVGDTIDAFRAAGLSYYNEAILVTSVGSLPIRAGKQFSASRKLGKTHQNVLVFVKGDGKKAAQACGEVTVDLGLLDESEGVAGA